MIVELIEDNNLLVKNAKKLVKLSEDAGDDATADIAISRIQVHEKNIWILNSHLIN